MSSAASERPRHTFASALKGAGLLERNNKGPETSDKDTRMADANSGGVKRTHKIRSSKTRPIDNIKDPGSNSRANLVILVHTGPNRHICYF